MAHNTLTLVISFPIFLIGVIYHTGLDVMSSGSFPVDATHVSTFYHPRLRDKHYWDVFLLFSLASIFGGIHCAGWNFLFPSHAQLMLWRVASLAVTILPLLAIPIGLLVGIIFLICFRDDNDFVTSFACAVIVLMYAIARLVLLGQAIALLRHLPPSALTAIDWAQFYPHFF